MDNATFGMTVTLVGMGGTLLTLWLISLMIVLLKKIFPLTENENANKTDG
jgi:Oxaloacetate decarboxylase, gamma chain